MTISRKHQSLSNMLRQLFACLILGGFIAIYPCEPLNRKQLLKASGTIECTDDESDTFMCGTNEVVNTSAPDYKEPIRTNREGRQIFLDDDDVGEVSARKKGRRGAPILLYIVGAMKAMLVYGLLNGVAAFAAKAVLIAKIALTIALAAILKKNDHEKVSYEIVKHPHTSYIQTHSSSVDYDHRSDYGDERNDYVYEHRKRRRIL